MATVLIGPSLIDALPLAPAHERPWCCVCTLAPRYRMLRRVVPMPCRPLKHSDLSGLMHSKWQIVRIHSSWSRA